MSARRHAGVAAAALASALAGCSLVSGWSDLQGGPKDGGSRDAGATSSDAGSSADADAGAQGGFRCGPVRCEGDFVCCVTNKLVCEPNASCAASSGYSLHCTERTACPNSELCCLDSAGITASCATTCDTSNGEEALCVPDDPASCFPGQTCTKFAGNLDLYQCQ